MLSGKVQRFSSLRVVTASRVRNEHSLRAIFYRIFFLAVVKLGN